MDIMITTIAMDFKSQFSKWTQVFSVNINYVVVCTYCSLTNLSIDIDAVKKY